MAYLKKTKKYFSKLFCHRSVSVYQESYSLAHDPTIAVNSLQSI